MKRLIAFTTSLGLVAWAALVVPMPFYEVQPGGAYPVEDLVTLSAATSEVDGDLDLLTVRQATPNILEALWVGLHPDRDLQPRTERTPVGLDRETYFDIQRDAFQTSFLTAVAVAAEEAGYAIQLETRAVVAQVLADGPSDGHLRPGDTITAIDGVSVDSGNELIAQLSMSDDPRPVTLEIERDGQASSVTIELRQLPQTDRPVLGIIVETVAAAPELPFDASLGDTNIVGPSAGLMLALTTADLLLEEDLARGRTIAGTGTISRDGTVGRVSAVEVKTRAAIDAGADLLLVPVEQLEEAAAAVEAGIDVIGVASFQDALEAVRGSSTGVAAAAG